MTYGYIRVSTDKQTVENQRFEVNQFCEKNAMIVDKWIEETISGTVEVGKRKLNNIMRRMTKGDVIIASELSRFGRTLLMIMQVLKMCMDKDVKIWTVKENYRLGDDISSKVLAFAFGLSAEIERNLISQRTKEALARKKSEGVILGRPKGSKSKRTKLTGLEEEMQSLLKNGVSKSAIARIMNVHRLTVSAFVKNGCLSGDEKWLDSISDINQTVKGQKAIRAKVKHKFNEKALKKQVKLSQKNKIEVK
jgi:DNA invertase Pin-like site-specific DNA recombinase